jgi:hypothetical protein
VANKRGANTGQLKLGLSDSEEELKSLWRVINDFTYQTGVFPSKIILHCGGRTVNTQVETLLVDRYRRKSIILSPSGLFSLPSSSFHLPLFNQALRRFLFFCF